MKIKISLLFILGIIHLSVLHGQFEREFNLDITINNENCEKIRVGDRWSAKFKIEINPQILLEGITQDNDTILMVGKFVRHSFFLNTRSIKKMFEKKVTKIRFILNFSIIDMDNDKTLVEFEDIATKFYDARMLFVAESIKLVIEIFDPQKEGDCSLCHVLKKASVRVIAKSVALPVINKNHSLMQLIIFD